jgi:hypothetical protein
MKKLIESGNTIIIVITFILFIVALLTTGMTKDILLEAGVFLVSVKIIIMSSSNRKSINELKEKLNEIIDKLNQLNNKT